MCCFYVLVFTSARSSRGDACLRWDWSVPLGRPHVSYVRYCFLLFPILFIVCCFSLSAVGLEPSSKAASSVSGQSLINILRRSSCHAAHCLPRRFLAPVSAHLLLCTCARSFVTRLPPPRQVVVCRLADRCQTRCVGIGSAAFSKLVIVCSTSHESVHRIRYTIHIYGVHVNQGVCGLQPVATSGVNFCSFPWVKRANPVARCLCRGEVLWHQAIQL